MVWYRKANTDWLKDHAIYIGVRPGDLGWRCKKTGVAILTKEVRRTVHSDHGPGHRDLSGDVRTITEIYCPECGIEPRIREGTVILETRLVER
jgi:hypothetical protein